MINVNNILTYDIIWRDNIFNEIFHQNEYDYKNIKVEKDDIVIDFGANIGIFSLYAEEKLAKTIYAFEPIKEYADLFRKNLEKYSNINFFQSAISYKDGKSEIIFNIEDNTILKDVWLEQNWKIDDKKEEIELISINNFMNNLEKVDYLKIDIEGSEYDIFENITTENLNKIRKIGGEYHWNYNNRLETTINKLKENNFDVYSFDTKSEFKIGKLFAIKKNNKQNTDLLTNNKGKFTIRK